MKKISIIGMLAAVLLLFAQCKNEQKSEPKNDEAQVESQEKTATDAEGASTEATAEDEGDAEGASEEMKLPLTFSGEKPTVKDVAIALGQRFSVEVIGEEEAEMENPGSLYESMAAAVKSGKAGDGEELKIDEEKGTVWFKQKDDETWSSVLAVLVDGDKAAVNLQTLKDGVLDPAQFDGVEVYKIDAANKVLIYENMDYEMFIDEKGNLK